MQVACNRSIRETIATLYLVPALLSSTLNAQQLKFQHIGVEQGLSQDIVTSIAQDSLGFMWFGTEDGLNKYDGYGVTVFKHDPRDTNSLSSSAIGTLVADSRGRLWVGTTGGGSVGESGTHKFSRIKLPAVAFCEGPDSTAWILTRDSLYRYSREGIISPVIAESEERFSASALLFDQRKKKLLVGTSTGLNVFSISRDTLIAELGAQSIASLKGHKVSALCRSSSGDIFVGTLDAGLFRLSSDLGKVEQYKPREGDPASLSDYRVLALAEDHKQRLWVGTFSGLDVLDRVSGKFTRYKDESNSDGLRGDRVYSICVDRGGALWVGTYRGGVNRFDPHRQRFAHVAFEPNKEGGLHGQNVYSLLETDDGDLWVGTDDGLFRRHNGTNRFRRYRHDPRMQSTLSNDGVFSLCQRRNGELWVGGGDGVVNRFERAEEEFVHYALPGGNAIRSIYETRDGRLLVGTDSRGAFVLDSIQRKFVPWGVQGDSSHPAGVWAMYQDRPGFLWLGTYYLPYIIRVDPATQTAAKIYQDSQHEGALVIPSVRAFSEIDDTLYLGTWAGGFARFNRQSDTYTWYAEVNGLPNNYIKAMQSDARGKIWIATEKGLARFDPKTESFRTYTVEDGLQSNFFWSGSSCKGKDGKLYFGGTNGFNSFHPDSISENMNVPSVVITSVRVLDKPFPMPGDGKDRTINLPYEADFFSFDFVALDYTFPERNQYAYMLEGFDKDWVKSGTRRYAAYTHLDPGRYVFRVKGSNNDGVWNETGTAIAIVIAPPYWMTWWFRGLIIVTVAAGLYVFYRYRLNQVLKVERLRQRIGRDLHDDIGTNLSAIVIASQVIRQQRHASPEVLDQVGDIGGIALKTQELMRDIVWMLNPRNDTLKEFVARMKHEAARLFKTIDYSFSAPDRELPEKVSLDFKRNMFLIYKEALNNIVKHAQARNVNICISVHDNTLKLTLQDDGLGFNPEKPSQGTGLVNMHSRAQHIGAALQILSTPGKGCTLELQARIA
jgi:ligand-binding sensor domain-containing protein